MQESGEIGFVVPNIKYHRSLIRLGDLDVNLEHGCMSTGLAVESDSTGHYLYAGSKAPICC